MGGKGKDETENTPFNSAFFRMKGIDTSSGFPLVCP
jgi:hypothetical protein